MQEIKTDVEPKSVPNSVPKQTQPTSAQTAPKQIPAMKAEVDKKISTYNGAETERYNWTQSTKSVDV